MARLGEACYSATFLCAFAFSAFQIISISVPSTVLSPLCCVADRPKIAREIRPQKAIINFTPLDFKNHEEHQGYKEIQDNRLQFFVLLVFLVVQR